jgi:hypothetical protein
MTRFGNRVFADGMKGLEIRSPWTHAIGPGRHIGIRSSPIELRGMVTFPKLCHLGPENGTSLGNRVFADGIKGLEIRSPWTHAIGPGRHIGIRSSPIELRGMVTFPKAVSPGT